MKLKKVMATLIACGLVGGMIYGGTLAYLTDNESHTNTVQVSGNIRIDLVEENWDETDSDSNGVPDAAQETVPNQEIKKDPKVINTGENPAFAFLRVTVPVKDVTKVLDDGTLVTKRNNTTPLDTTASGEKIYHEPQDIFYFKQENDAISAHSNNWYNKWKRLESKEYNTELKSDNATFNDQAVGQAVYVFGYEDVIAANGGETHTLFDKIQIKNIIENEITPDQIQNIKVEAFAIQSDNLIDSAGAKITKTSALTSAELTDIYTMFVKQNGTFDTKGDMVWNTYQDEEHGQTEKEAEISNQRNLNNTTSRVTTTLKNVKATKTDLKVGETSQMSYEAERKAGATGGPRYTSSNPEVATVNEANGLITAVKKGNATITVELDGVKASVQVNVMNDSRDQNADNNVDVNDESNIPNGTTEP